MSQSKFAMKWLDEILDSLNDQAGWAYVAGGPPATEPMAVAALALAGHGLLAEAQQVCRRLAELQSSDGSVGISPSQPKPGWPTGWAVLAWQSIRETRGQAPADDSPVQRAVGWLLGVKGKTSQRNWIIGHNTTLTGWPWVIGTHSWIEPTAVALLALKSVGLGDHPRAREAVTLLTDRLFQTGGCNYGNTSVLGQTLRPHLAPSGLTLAALAGEDDASGRIASTLAYVLREVAQQPTAMSLAYGLIGLAAHDQFPSDWAAWLAAACQRTRKAGASPFRLALLALAASGRNCPLLTHNAILTKAD